MTLQDIYAIITVEYAGPNKAINTKKIGLSGSVLIIKMKPRHTSVPQKEGEQMEIIRYCGNVKFEGNRRHQPPVHAATLVSEKHVPGPDGRAQS